MLQHQTCVSSKRIRIQARKAWDFLAAPALITLIALERTGQKSNGICSVEKKGSKKKRERARKQSTYFAELLSRPAARAATSDPLAEKDKFFHRTHATANRRITVSDSTRDPGQIYTRSSPDLEERTRPRERPTRRAKAKKTVPFRRSMS
jgi:hypothetical protein